MNVCADQATATRLRSPEKRAAPPSGNAKVLRPVDALLSADVLRQLRTAIEPVPRVTRKLVSELEIRFDIERNYGVSLNRLASFLGRSRKKWQHASLQAESCERDVVTTQPDTVPIDGAPADSVDAGLLRDHRHRQASVASILENTFGRLAQSDPTLWDRRAYQLLVGLVYERLACDKEELPTVELVALAKVLNESRRADKQAPSKADAKRGSAGDEVTPQPSPTGELPKRFGDLIRQVYGTSIDGLSSGESTGAIDSPAEAAAASHDESRLP